MIYRRNNINCKFCCKLCKQSKKMFCNYNCEKEATKCEGYNGEMNKILTDSQQLKNIRGDLI